MKAYHFSAEDHAGKVIADGFVNRQGICFVCWYDDETKAERYGDVDVFMFAEQHRVNSIVCEPYNDDPSSQEAPEKYPRRGLPSPIALKKAIQGPN